MEGFLLQLTVLFFLIEAIVEVAQKLVEEFHWKALAAFLLGALGAVFFGIDLFSYLGVPAAIEIPWLVIVINALFVGVLVARYSGEINALLEILQGFKSDAQRKLG